MPHSKFGSAPWAALLTLLLFRGPAWAGEHDLQPLVMGGPEIATATLVGAESAIPEAATEETPAPADLAPSSPAAPSAPGAALDGEDLDAMRGGAASTSSNSIRVVGTVDNNSAININSGDNALNGGAFANASGINTVIQNSGSNVLIQNATAVTIQFGGPTP